MHKFYIIYYKVKWKLNNICYVDNLSKWVISNITLEASCFDELYEKFKRYYTNVEIISVVRL